MEKLNWIFILIFLSFLNWKIHGHERPRRPLHLKKEAFSLVCYYSIGNSGLYSNNIDSSLCTHILIGFATVRNATLCPSSPNDIKIYKDIINLKRENPQLKVMLSVGGAGGEGGLPGAVRQQLTRTRLIDQSLSFLTEYGFDGIDFDWEFPGYPKDPMEDREYFNLFLKELYNATRAKPLLLLSVAVAAVLPIIDFSYKVSQMAESVDFINLMSYDYFSYQPYFPFTQHNSPLYSKRDEIVILRNLNTAWSANYWMKQGMPKSKIMIGIPTYGHTYTLLRSDMNGLNAPAVGNGIGGGDCTYSQICEMLRNGGTRVYDNVSKVPFIYKDLDWRSYDDLKSVTIKSQWLGKQGFGGAMIFDLNADDWNATCDGKTTFPLIKAIRHTLQLSHRKT